MLAYDDREDAAAREEAAKKFIAEHYTSKLVEKGVRKNRECKRVKTRQLRGI